MRASEGEASKRSQPWPGEQVRLTHLINQNVGTEILERELELLEAVVDGDLDGDKGVRAGVVASVMARSRHDGLL